MSTSPDQFTDAVVDSLKNEFGCTDIDGFVDRWAEIRKNFPDTPEAATVTSAASVFYMDQRPLHQSWGQFEIKATLLAFVARTERESIERERAAQSASESQARRIAEAHLNANVVEAAERHVQARMRRRMERPGMLDPNFLDITNQEHQSDQDLLKAAELAALPQMADPSAGNQEGESTKLNLTIEFDAAALAARTIAQNVIKANAVLVAAQQAASSAALGLSNAEAALQSAKASDALAADDATTAIHKREIAKDAVKSVPKGDKAAKELAKAAATEARHAAKAAADKSTLASETYANALSGHLYATSKKNAADDLLKAAIDELHEATAAARGRQELTESQCEDLRSSHGGLSALVCESIATLFGVKAVDPTGHLFLQYASIFHHITGAPKPVDLTATDAAGVFLAHTFVPGAWDTWREFCDYLSEKERTQADSNNIFMPQWLSKAPDRPNMFLRSFVGAEGPGSNPITEQASDGGVTIAKSFITAMNEILRPYSEVTCDKKVVPQPDSQLTMHEFTASISSVSNIFPAPMGDTDIVDGTFRHSVMICLIGGLGTDTLRQYAKL